MKSYDAIDIKEIRKSSLVFAAIFGVGCLVLAVFRRNIFAAIVGAICILVSGFRKHSWIDEEGIATETTLFSIMRTTERWTMQEMTAVSKEITPNRKYYLLFFEKGNMAKRLMFKVEDVAEIFEMIQDENPDIEIF